MIDPSVPLVDLHRHLDGNIKAPTIWALANKFGIDIPAQSLDDVKALCEIQGKTSDLMAFLSKLDFGISMLINQEAVYDIAYQNMQDAMDEGIDYLELRFSPVYMASAHQLDLHQTIEAVIAGVKAGSEAFGVKANLIGIMSRTYGTTQCQKELDALLIYKDAICGLDLAGDEKNFPARDFVSHFAQARDAGWHVTVHAGEAEGPQSVWDAIELLGAERIGHGIAAQHDRCLMDTLANRGIGLEVCPTSNYQTGTVVNTASHPLKTFLDAGIQVTLNTDDPGVSAITLADEYRIARDVIGLSSAQLKQIQQQGLTQSFLDSEAKKLLIETAGF